MPELRKDWLSGQWVAFSTERLRRPQQFKSAEVLDDPEADPFKEGHESSTPPEVFAIRPNGGEANGPGWTVRVVPNRYPALRVEGGLLRSPVGLYDQITGVGAHEVVIETPHANRELEQHALHQISEVLETYRVRTLDLMRDQRMQYVSIFKNAGMLAGASLKHAHSQLIALPLVPSEVGRRIEIVDSHYKQRERSLFGDVLQQEKHDGRRIVLENQEFVAFCPYASRFPFEVRVLPKTESCHYFEATDRTLVQLAEILKKVLGAYRAGLNRPAYNLLFHTAPLPGPGTQRWPTLPHAYRWHLEMVPRIFGIAGFELSTGSALNAVYPEEAARFLRETIDALKEDDNE